MHGIDEDAVLRRRCATFRIHQHRDAEQPAVPHGHTVRREAYRRQEISRGRVLDLGKMLGMKADVLLRLAEAARGE
ncbi:MAG: hypothetical protein OXC01_01900 [Immundisolibacterales bacterium]|nr:hypothetical protein [Immundisolibacterales bacterium]